eukprot:4206041-Pyramimonas_sp.AAC.1
MGRLGRRSVLCHVAAEPGSRTRALKVKSTRGQRVILPLHPLAERDPARSARIELHGLHSQ